MGPEDLPYDRKPQACAHLVLPAGEVRLVEAVEDQLLVLLRDADAGVLDAREHLVAALCRLHLHRGVRVAELDRVVDKVVEHLLNPARVGVDVQFFPGQDQGEGDLLGMALMLKGCGDLADHLVEVKVRLVQDHAAGVQVVEGEEIIGQFCQTVGLVEAHLQVLAMQLRRDGAVEHRLEKAVDGGEGRAEVVGDVRDELLLVILLARDLACHVVERGRKVAHLILGVHREGVVHVAGGVLLGRLRDLPKRHVYDLGKEDEDDDGQKKQNQKLHVGDLQHLLGACDHKAHRIAHDDIADGPVVACDRSKDADLVLIEGIVERPLKVRASRKVRGIKPVDRHRNVRVELLCRVHHHATRGVEDQDPRIVVGREGAKLGVDRVNGCLGVVQIRRVGVCDRRRLGQQRVRLHLLFVVEVHVRDHRGHHDEAEDPEQDVGQDKFEIKGLSHSFAASGFVTSNLYPMPQIVEMRQ